MHNDPNSTWHVAGNLMGCELSPLLSRPLCDRVLTSLYHSARWICSWQIANYAVILKSFWYWTLAHIEWLGSLAICTKVNHRLAYRCGNPLWHGRSRKWIQDKTDESSTVQTNQSKSVGRMMVGYCSYSWCCHIVGLRLSSFICERSLSPVSRLAGYAVDKLPTLLWFWSHSDTGLWPILDM